MDQPFQKSYWNNVKTKLKRMRGCHRDHLESYFDEQELIDRLSKAFVRVLLIYILCNFCFSFIFFSLFLQRFFLKPLTHKRFRHTVLINSTVKMPTGSHMTIVGVSRECSCVWLCRQIPWSFFSVDPNYDALLCSNTSELLSGNASDLHMKMIMGMT